MRILSWKASKDVLNALIMYPSSSSALFLVELSLALPALPAMNCSSANLPSAVFLGHSDLRCPGFPQVKHRDPLRGALSGAPLVLAAAGFLSTAVSFSSPAAYPISLFGFTSAALIAQLAASSYASARVSGRAISLEVTKF